MPRILIINPNRSQACTAAITDAIAPLIDPDGPTIDVIGLADGPPAILTWDDWHAAAEPLRRKVQAEPADVYVIACASDPGVDAVRAVTSRPVFGVFRCAVASAAARARQFGVIAIVDASKERHLAVLRAMQLESRLAAEVALNVSMDTLLDPTSARAALIDAGKACVAKGAGAVVLGCTGMAGHKAAIQAACGVPVIEPCQAGAIVAILALQDS